jgi:hypothetical protein
VYASERIGSHAWKTSGARGVACLLSTCWALLGGVLLQPRFGQFEDTFGAHRAAPLIGSAYCCSLLLLSVAWSQWLVLVAWCVKCGSIIGGLTLACNVLVQAW